MKYLDIKKLTAGFAVLGCLVAGSASALTIDSPGVVGTIVVGEPASDANEAIWVNYLLSLGATTTSVANLGNPAANHTFTTGINDFNGTVSSASSLKDTTGNNSVPAGYDFVLAKYDGPHGGDVVFATGGAAFTLPTAGDDFFTSNLGLGLSHFVAYIDTSKTPPVPDGGSTVLLLGVGLSALALAHRKLS